MASIQLRDKLMAKLMLEEIISGTLVETNGTISPLSDIKVSGFDQDIYAKDLLEDYGWLGSWMHLAEMYYAGIGGQGKMFKEQFKVSPDWLGGIMPVHEEAPPVSPAPKILDGDSSTERATHYQPISFTKTQLLLRMALLDSLNITPDNKASFSRPTFQSSLISQAAVKGKEDSLLHEPKEVISEMFFTQIRQQMSPALSLFKEASPNKES